MATNPGYRIECPICGEAPWHRCRWTFDESKDRAGEARHRMHKERAIDGAERKKAYLRAVGDVPCPQCGARPGHRCRRISRRVNNTGQWEYCSPWGNKKSACTARYAAARGYGMLDPEESAADGGMLVPPEFHESAAETGLLGDLP